MIPGTSELRFEVTTKCNYKCIICPHDTLTRKYETMPLDTFKVLLDKAMAEKDGFKTLTFPGMGEAMMDKTLEEKISYSNKYDLTKLILTNGSLLTVDKFKRLEELGTGSIRVSMYGNTPESYMAIHGLGNKNMFHKVKENLAEICRIKKTTSIILTCNVLEKYNLSDLEGWIDYWEDRADLLEVWKPHNWADAKTYRDTQQQKVKTCGRPWNTPIQILVDGTVNMCCFDFDGKLLLGDLKTQSLEEIFNSPMFNKILGHHKSGDFKGSGLICEICDQRNEDKSDVMVYNSRFDVQERIKKLSTTYDMLSSGD